MNLVNRTILFFPVHQSAAKEMAVVARGAQEAGAKVVFWARLPETRSCLLGEGVDQRDIFSPSKEDGSAGNTKKISWSSVLKQQFAKTCLGRWLWVLRARSEKQFESRVQAELRVLEREYVELSELFDSVAPDVVAVSSDRGKWDELSALQLCREKSLSSIIIPYAIAADKLTMPLVRRGPTYDADAFPLIRDAYNHMVAENCHTGKKCLFYAPWIIVALDRVGLLPEKPWVLGGGNSDWILVDGKIAKDRLIAHGCHPDKIRITGMASYDSLYKSSLRKKKVRRSIVETCGFDASRKLAIFAVPSFYEQNVKDWEDNYLFLQRVLQAFKAADFNVLLSLHPRMKEEEYRFMVSEGFALANQSLSEILSAADLFVTTVSSTAMWAPLLGIPQVVLNDVGLPDDYYRQLPGAFFDEASDVEELSRIMRKALSVSSEIFLEGKGGGVQFDGRSTERIVKLLMEL